MKPVEFTVTITAADVDDLFNTPKEAQDYIEWLAKHRQDYAYEAIMDRVQDEWVMDFDQWRERQERAAIDDDADRNMEEQWIAKKLAG